MATMASVKRIFLRRSGVFSAETKAASNDPPGYTCPGVDGRVAETRCGDRTSVFQSRLVSRVLTVAHPAMWYFGQCAHRTYQHRVSILHSAHCHYSSGAVRPFPVHVEADPTLWRNLVGTPRCPDSKVLRAPSQCRRGAGRSLRL